MLKPGIGITRKGGTLSKTQEIAHQRYWACVQKAGGDPSYPDKLLRPEWINEETNLSDGDLYLRTLDAAGIHPGISDALREAVRCFTAELYLPTLAMLDAASEGAWLEAGTALNKTAPNKKLEATLADPRASIRSKVEVICGYYEYEKSLQKAGITAGHLRDTQQWSGLVRDARNVLHWNVTTAIPNDYTTVSNLMLAALNHIKRLHTIAT